MKRTIMMAICLLSMAVGKAQEVMEIPKGDAQALLTAIETANKKNADKKSKPLYILIPDGFYDLGEKVLTKITGHNIALIGQSMEGTIIQNKPDVKNEGISKTAIFQNRGSNNYFQDMTLKNALEYYAAGSAGRAVPCRTRAHAPSATACGCCHTKTPTTATVRIASYTSRTRRFTVRWTSSAVLVTSGLNGARL